MLARDKKAGNRWIAGLLMQTGSLVQMRYELDGSWRDKNAVFSMQRPIKEQKRNPLREQRFLFVVLPLSFAIGQLLAINKRSNAFMLSVSAPKR